MKTLMLGWEYPPHVTGGLGVACRGLADGLAASGVEVLFVLPRAFGDEQGGGAEILGCDRRPAGAGLPVDSPLEPYQSRAEYLRRLGELTRRLPQAERPEDALPECFSFLGGYGRELTREVERYARAVTGTVRGRSFDVIHAHDWMTWPAGLRLRQDSGRPLVCHVHAIEADRAGAAADPGIEAVEELGLRGADRVVCVSRWTRDRVQRRYGVAEERLSVVHNALDRDVATVAPRERRGPPTVLFVGRLTHQKGVDTFLRAARRIADERPDTRFVIVGEGSLRGRAEDRARQLELTPRVRFTGFLAGEDLERAWRDADVYLMPSVAEPFGLTALEATAHGLPVVLSTRCGAAEILPAPTVDFRDVEAWSARTLELLDDPALGRRRVAAAQAALAPHDWPRRGRELASLYAGLIRAPRGAGCAP